MKKNKRQEKEANPASLAMVAQMAGVSVATVSRVVNGQTNRASAQTVERVRQAIQAVGYVPNQLGRALRSRESRVVAMLAANLDNPVMATIAASTEAALRQAGYVMILCDTHDNPDLQDDYLNAMRSQLVSGYVMVASQPSRALQEFFDRGTPMVFVSRRYPFGQGFFVGPDNTAAGADAADYLLGCGVTQPAVVFPANGSSTTQERVHGFCQRMQARGVDLQHIRQVAGNGASHLAVGYSAAQQLGAAPQWPRGIACISDQVAYGVYRAARERGLQVPADTHLVGIDGNPINAWLAPWLASVEIPHAAFGAQIVELLQSAWAGDAPRETLLAHRLVGVG